ncbi:MAG TPA: hypothetical protein VGB37_00160 [Candidatus Lokiarchaeia archaeon]
MCGIGVTGQGSVWAGSGFSFLMIILTGEGLSTAQYFFINTFWMAISLFFWMWTITELKYKGKQKIILLIYAIMGITFEIYLIYYLITDPSIIGEVSTPPLDITYHGIAMIFTLFVLASICISLFLFAGSSLKTGTPDIKLKAKFLLIAMISFVIGAFADGFVTLTMITVFVIRILLISSAIEVYIGWVLPEFVRKLFLKET